MRGYPHFSNYGDLGEAVLAFGQLARDNGFNAGVGEGLELLNITDDPDLADKAYLKYGLKAVLCTCKENTPVFDKMFDSFWSSGSGLVKSKTTYQNKSNISKQGKASLVMLGQGHSEGETEDSSNVSGANAVERLRKTDFSKLTHLENELLEELAMRLWKQMSMRLKRRMRSSSNGKVVDLRSTIRKNLSHGGEPIELFRKSRKPRKQRLVVLLDVSGSMDKYSYFLLRFIWSLRSHFEAVEAFIFSTSLIRITDYLDAQNLQSTLRVLSHKANNWSSGTKIGECFEDFNEKHAKKVLNGSSTVIVLSDGLDTVEPEDLVTQLHRIRRRTKRVIWLNPLKGMEGYQPIQRGMSAALEEVDIFRSAHSLDSLLQLERFLMQI